MREFPVLPCEIRLLAAADGVELFVRNYQPANAPVTRTLLWCHGMGEHGGRHDHVVAELLSRDWQVIIPDLRGLGRSGGIRSDVARFDVYLNDLDRIVSEFQLDPSRTVLFGHSFGGLVMTRYAQSRPHGWMGLAMSAPLLGLAVKIPVWKWWLGRLLRLVAPRTHLKTGIRESNLTADPSFLALRRADPLIHRSVTVRWFYAMRSALRAAHRHARKLKLPILVLHGLDDETTDPRIPAKWLRHTSSRDVQLLEYPGGLHEMLHDAEWLSVCTDLLNWLEQRFSTESAWVRSHEPACESRQR